MKEVVFMLVLSSVALNVLADELELNPIGICQENPQIEEMLLSDLQDHYGDYLSGARVRCRSPNNTIKDLKDDEYDCTVVLSVADRNSLDNYICDTNVNCNYVGQFVLGEI